MTYYSVSIDKPCGDSDIRYTASLKEECDRWINDFIIENYSMIFMYGLAIQFRVSEHTINESGITSSTLYTRDINGNTVRK